MPGRHITEDQRIICSRLLELKLCNKGVGQPPDLGLVNSARVVSDKPCQAFVWSLTPYPSRSIERMKTCYRKVGCIPHVMKVCGRHQYIPILLRNYLGNPASLLRDLLDMRPTVSEGHQEPFSTRCGPRCQEHRGHTTTDLGSG